MASSLFIETLDRFEEASQQVQTAVHDFHLNGGNDRLNKAEARRRLFRNAVIEYVTSLEARNG